MMFSTSVSADDGSDVSEVCPKNGKNHSWYISRVVKEPTCTEEGIDEYKCKNCGATKNVTVKANGHRYGYTPEYIAGSCTTDSKFIYRCLYCDYVDVSSVFPAEGHKWEKIGVVKEATCTANGVYQYQCRECRSIKNDTVSATGHSTIHLDRIDPSYNSVGHEPGEYCVWCNKYVSGGASIPKTTHKEEWYGGKWYNSKGKISNNSYYKWHKDSTGWWFTNEFNKYAYGGWLKIEGDWYYFKYDGYMAQNEWIDGYWFGNSGAWTYKATLSWHRDSNGWWAQDSSGWYPRSQWQKIDGYWYYFNASGYMVTNQYVDGYWLGSDGTYY